MKDLYNTVSEGILDIADQDLDTDTALIAVNEWARHTQIGGCKYTKKDIVEEDGELILMHDYASLNISLPCPIKLKFTDRAMFGDKLLVRIQSTPRSIKQGVTILDSIEEFKAICDRSNVWHVGQLSIEVSEKANLPKPLYVPELSASIEYNKITIHCNNALEVDTGMVVRAGKLEIHKPKFIRMLGMPQGPKIIEITQ